MATFTCTVPGGPVQLSGNPILIVGTTDTPATGITDHFILCKVTCTNNAIPGGPWTDSIAPLAGSATFDISELVDTVFAYIFNTEVSAASRFHERATLSADITVEIGESYIDADGDLVETWSAAPEEITILKGKLTRHEFNIINANGLTFYTTYVNDYNNVTKWLTKLETLISIEHSGTWRRPVLNVSSVSDEVKGWFIAPSNDDMHVICYCYYSDGTEFTYSDPSTHTVTKDKLYEIDLNKFVSNTENKTVTQYLLYLYGSNFETEMYTVNVDNTYHETQQTLFFSNTLGVVEAMQCYGETKEEITTKGETVSLNNYGFAVLTPTIVMVNGEYKTRYKINTGFKTLSERRWFRDMLISENVWLKQSYPIVAHPSDINCVPVVIVPGSYTIDDTSEDLTSIDFEVEVAHEY
jgi:hypothetical protein